MLLKVPLPLCSPRSTSTDSRSLAQLLMCAARPSDVRITIGHGLCRLSCGRTALSEITRIAWTHLFAGMLLLVHRPSLAADAPPRQWSISSSDCQHRVIHHERVDPQSSDRSDVSAETITIKAGHGTHIYAIHPIAPARVADELEIRVGLQADRSHLQLFARVLLPRSRDPATGRPFTVLVPGEQYRDKGTWQVLKLDELPRRLEERVRVLRSQVDTPIDAREAAVDLVVLNLYGGAGTTTASIQPISVDRLLESTDAANSAPARTRATASTGIDGPSNVAVAETDVRLVGDLLHVDGRPMFVRAIDHSGEPFEFLTQLGFNAVRLTKTATHEQLVEADRCGIWLVCPPPDETATRRIDTSYRPVLAWDVGSELGPAQFNDTVETITAVRELRLLPARPVLGWPDSHLAAYGRQLDILVHRRDLLGTSFPLLGFGPWLHQRRHLAPPGRYHWASIQTEAIPELLHQAWLFGDEEDAPLPDQDVTVEAEQIRSLAMQAVGQGMRGLHFRSNTRLDIGTSSSNYRTKTLQLLNMELQQIAPWVAGGTVDENLAEDQPAGICISTIRTSRATLVIIARHSAADQIVASPGSATSMDVLISGLSAAPHVFELTSVGPHPCSYQRVTGGIRVTLQPHRNDAMVVLTEDPAIMNHLSRDLTTQLASVATLRQALAQQEFEQTEIVWQRIQHERSSSTELLAAREQALAALHNCAASMRDENFLAAERLARAASSHISTCRRQIWLQANRTLAEPTASPLCLRFDRIPRHFQIAHVLSRCHQGTNLLPGGNFESLDNLVDQQWECRQHPTEGFVSEVRVDTSAGFHGQSCLRMSVQPNTEAGANIALESTPLWVNSPPIPVKSGQIVMIHGWANIPDSVQSNLDGLMIFDSLAGPALGTRMRKTDGWQEFQLFRVAEVDGTVQVTFALPGAGEAMIDDVSVRTLSPPGPTVAHSEDVLRR